MAEFHATLIREKFMIRDMQAEAGASGEDDNVITAYSNRMSVSLQTPSGAIKEQFVVRAQTMHVCVRFAAYLAKEFEQRGPIMSRQDPFDWSKAYYEVTRGYESKWNKKLWVAVYRSGDVLHKEGYVTNHPFLDVIEQCDSENGDYYDNSVKIAKKAFKDAGKTVDISHDTHVALVVNVKPEEARCGLVERGPNRNTTFSFTAKSEAGKPIRVPQVLSVCAAYLEAIQLAFYVGMSRYRVASGVFDSRHPEAKRSGEGGRKLALLKQAIDKFNTEVSVTYRPERPNFTKLVDSAEDYARRTMDVDEEKRRAAMKLREYNREIAVHDTAEVSDEELGQISESS